MSNEGVHSEMVELLETGGGGRRRKKVLGGGTVILVTSGEDPGEMGVYSQGGVNPNLLRGGGSSWMVRPINKCDHGLKVTPTPRAC